MSRQTGGKAIQDGLSNEDYNNIDIEIQKALFRSKVNRLPTNDDLFKHIFDQFCQRGNNYRGEPQTKENKKIREAFIAKLETDPRKEIKVVKTQEKKKFFEKKIGFQNENPPSENESFKKEIKEWPRIGMKKEDESQIMYYQPKPKEHKTYGFQKMHEFDFTYTEIQRDLEISIKEGLVVEFKDESVHSTIDKKDKNQSDKRDRRTTSVLYPVNMDDNEFEVRGQQGKYDDNSLQILSKLWDEFDNHDNDWKKVINENKDKLLPNDAQKTQYEYRVDILNNFMMDDDDEKEKLKGLGKKKKQANDHMTEFDFTTEYK